MPTTPTLYRVHLPDGSVIPCQRGHQALVLALLNATVAGRPVLVEVGVWTRDQLASRLLARKDR